MTKRIAILMLGVALLLAACQSPAMAPAAQPTSGVTAVEQTQDLAAASTTAPVPALQETQPDPGTAAPIQASGPATCTAVSRQPTPGATEQSLFPPAGEDDWVEGPPDAALTFFEYSDFQ